MNDFEGLVAIVTGGAGGIGAAVITQLRERGCTAISLDRTGDGIQCDITSDEDVAAAIAEVVAQHGRLDIVINNAGIGAVGTIEQNDIAEWQRVFDVNVYGMVRVSTAAMPWLKKSPAASIVNTASIVADTGLVARALYSASKGAVASLTRAMAADGLADGVRVNAVSPGTADTPWVERLLEQATDPAAAKAALVARQPIGRLISPEEIAHGIAYLASPLSGSTTGTVLPIDGGVHALR